MADMLRVLENALEDIDDLTEDQSLQDIQIAEQLKQKTEDMFSKLRKAIESLHGAADKIEQVWRDSRVLRASGTSIAICGSVFTLAGGIATIMSAGIASPLLFSGMAVGFAGASANVTGSIMEAVIKSKEVEKAKTDLKEAKEGIKDVKEIIEDCLKKEKLSWFLCIQKLAKDRKWNTPVLKVVVGLVQAAKVLSNRGQACAGAAVKALGEEAGKAGAGSAGKAGMEAAGKVGAGTADDVLNTGMKAGSKVAGQVIIGVSAVFLLWDVVNLSCTIDELWQNKGSDAAKDLIRKAKKLEDILNKLEQGEMV